MGGYPRSQRVRHVLRDLEKGRVGLDEAMRVVLEETVFLLGFQAGCGLDPVSDPVLEWHDLLRPFAASWRNVSIDGLERFFDNNFFYRIPVLHGKPDPSEPVLARRAHMISKRLPPGLRLKLVAPGPVTFAMLSRLEGLGWEEAAEEVARILGWEARLAREAGARVLELAEPWLGDPDAKPEHAVLLAELVDRYIAGAGLEVIVSVYYHPPLPEALKALSESKASMIVVDYVDNPERALEALSRACPEGLGLGVIDARSIYMEPLDRVEKAVSRVLERCKPERLALTTSAPLDLLPYQAALEKTRLLGLVAARLRES